MSLGRVSVMIRRTRIVVQEAWADLRYVRLRWYGRKDVRLLPHRLGTTSSQELDRREKITEERSKDSIGQSGQRSQGLCGSMQDPF